MLVMKLNNIWHICAWITLMTTAVQLRYKYNYFGERGGVKQQAIRGGPQKGGREREGKRSTCCMHAEGSRSGRGRG
jgi:hypothetical protein